MTDFNKASMLEVLETFAEVNDKFGLVLDEEHLSDMFDNEVAPEVIEMYGIDDKVALQQAFFNYSHELSVNGLLHPIQEESYSYIGQYQ